ncbi:hypothetical protein C8T65DRAFT_586995 [Cerioporus squamosus]|nr:hypothetical protein C8T65DRAFT_586995 [Cerioporus squamosus]
MISEKRQGRWNSYIYVFYKPMVEIIVISPTKITHEFTCAKPGCKETIRRYQDTEDATSTGNMTGHAVACWGNEIVSAVKAVGGHTKCCPMVESFGRSGTITKMFKHIGKGKVSYMTRQHTSMETRYNKQPYEIVHNCVFLTLMKTGRPKYKIPSPSTISRDVRHVFTRCRSQIAKMLKDFEGDLSFTCDTWTSPNHKVLVAFAVHLHHEGTPLSFLLDVVEIAESHMGEVLAKAFETMLREFEISEKVR